MASPSLLRVSTRPDYFVCARCAFRTSNALSRTTRRWMGMKYLSKVADAEIAWAEKASRIRAGKEKSMLTVLDERGLIYDFAGKQKDFDRMITDRRLGAYVGIDPTAASLHVGHMIPFMSLFWMYVHGYHTVSLLGGATAKIGDPTGRLTSREKEHASIGTAHMANMHVQLKNIWINVEKYGKKYGYKWEWAWHRELVNNNVWWNSLPMLDVLKILGPGMRLGSMLARDTVKNKMSKGDGMSFAEFTYPIMQAWDWWHMFHTKGINMQIGGSDQFGNITAGIDAVKYISTHHPDPVVRCQASAVGEPFGFTVPLLTTSSGQKFGKSAGNAVWLDNEMTSTFDLYKYFLGTSDADVGKYLKMFTFMPIKDIEILIKEHMQSPQQRKAQHKLARDFVELIHGEEEAKLAETQHRLLFKNPVAGIFPKPTAYDPDAGTVPVTVNNKPKINVQLPHHVIYQKSMGKILYAAGLARSSSDGYRLIHSEGAYIGTSSQGPMNDGYISWGAITEWKPEDTKKFLVYDDLLLLRRSKNNISIVQVVPDEEYALSGQNYPGMALGWRIGVLKALNVKASITRQEQESIARLIKEDESFLAAHTAEQLKANAQKEAKMKKAPSTDALTTEKPPLPRIDFTKKPKPIPEADQASWVDRL